MDWSDKLAEKLNKKLAGLTTKAVGIKPKLFVLTQQALTLNCAKYRIYYFGKL